MRVGNSIDESIYPPNTSPCKTLCTILIRLPMAAYQAIARAIFRRQPQNDNPPPLSTHAIKSTFDLALSKSARHFAPDFFARQQNRIRDNRIVHRSTISRPSKRSGHCVDWDQSCVIATTSPKRPFTKDLRPCIAVLMRALDASTLTHPAYLSTTHVFTELGVVEFKHSLRELIEKTRREAIQIFLCGGCNPPADLNSSGDNAVVRRFSNGLHREILDEAAREGVTIVQDLVGLAHAEGRQEEGLNRHNVRFGIGSTGFDDQCNPYAIVDVQCSRFKGHFTPGTWWVN